MYMPMLCRNDFFRGFDDYFDLSSNKYDKRCQNDLFNNKSLMNTDVKENDNIYIFDINLQWVKKDDVSITFNDGYITISTEVKKENEEKNEKEHFIRKERFIGNCSRSFYVGDNVVTDDIKANFNDGVLHLDIPKHIKENENKKIIKID